MLIAAGMKPVKAAVVSLLANTAPVAFGAMAAPIIALSGVTGIDIHLLSQMAGRQTPFLAMFVPLILVFIVDGRRGVRQTWPVAVVAGLAFLCLPRQFHVTVVENIEPQDLRLAKAVPERTSPRSRGEGAGRRMRGGAKGRKQGSLV